MSEPIRFFEDLDPAARARVLKRLEKPGPDGIVPAESLLIRQHLRPSLRRLRPERQRQPARQLLTPVEPFLVDRAGPDGLPLVPRALLRPLIRHLAGRLPGPDWTSGGPLAPDMRATVAGHLAGLDPGSLADLARAAGLPPPPAAAALETLTLCLREAEMIEDWGRELPPGPILWIDSGLMERIVLAHGRATRKEGRLGRLLVVLVARRLHDPALLTAALAAAVGVAAPSAELKSDVAAVVGPLARALAADGLAGLERSAGEDALGTIDFFRIRQVLHAAAVDGKAEETEARLAALLGRVASGTLQAEVEALLSGGAGSVAAGEVERSLRELSALSREGGISGLVADLTAIAAAIAARLRLDPGGPELLYRLHLLELCGGAEMAHALYRELRPGGRATRAGS